MSFKREQLLSHTLLRPEDIYYKRHSLYLHGGESKWGELEIKENYNLMRTLKKSES